MRRTDAHWRQLGQADPYNVVHANDPSKTTRRSKAHYFDNPDSEGEQHLDNVFATIRRHFDPDFSPRVGVDFGCSIGRICLPLAKRCERVIGIDISPGMMAEARRNCEEFGITNADFRLSDDTLSAITEELDLFHTFQVLQHIHRSRGERILEAAADKLAPGGVGVVHFMFHDRRSSARRAVHSMLTHIPFAINMSNVARGRPWSRPHMLMNTYSMEHVMDLLTQHGCGAFHGQFLLEERFSGVILYFRKPRQPS